jgi:hypothetical protein
MSLKLALIDRNRVAHIYDEEPHLPAGAELVDVAGVDGIAVGWMRHSDGSFHLEPEPPHLTDELRDGLLRYVDESCEAARSAFVTPGSSQAEAYRQKLAEAQALQGDKAPNPDDYPILAGSVGVDVNADGTPTQTIAAVAAVVISTARAWSQIIAVTEGLRLTAKRDVRAATTWADATAAARVTWPTPA